MDNRFLFIGGDRRIIYAALSILHRRSVSALGLGDTFSLPEGRYGSIVLPLPFHNGHGGINAPLTEKELSLSLVTDYADKGAFVFSGGISPALSQLCEEHGLRLIDYYAEETLTLKNAALTAESAVAMLIQETEFSLSGSRVIITGGGRIALLTARLLRCFGSAVTLCARNRQQRTRAALEHHDTADVTSLPALCATADIIINTVPAALFSEDDFRRMKAGTVFMELASKPAQPDSDYAAKYGVRHIMAGGLPGKMCPKTAGEAIAEVILAKG